MKSFTLGIRSAAPAALVLSFAAAALAAAAVPRHVRGTLAHVSAGTLTVTTAAGATPVAVDAKTTVVGVVPAALSDVVPGTFVGIANVGGAGNARALEVVVFPAAMAGTGEGDYAWDLPAGNGRSRMTNGTVASAPRHAMMTNATVTSVSAGDEKTVRLAYRGGTKTLLIPRSAPIVRIVPGSKALLVAGARVFIVAPPGYGAARFVVVGEHGAVPPM